MRTARQPDSQIRRPKEGRNPKAEIRRPKSEIPRSELFREARVSNFTLDSEVGTRISAFLRPSDFGFRISVLLLLACVFAAHAQPASPPASQDPLMSLML